MDQLINSIIVLLFMSVSLMTWNVTGIMSSLGYLGDALVQHSVDICGISEHWLFPQNLYILDYVATDYNVHAVCDSLVVSPEPVYTRLCSYRLQRTCCV